MAAAGAAMPAVPQAQVLSTYSYYNAALKGTNLEYGVMWVNEQTRQISFQTAKHVTPWHGAFMVNDDGVEWNIFFNAKTTPENIANVAMWSTVVLKTTTNEWVGHDFQGRPISMKPLTNMLVAAKQRNA